MLNLFKKKKKNVLDDKILQSKYACKYVRQGHRNLGESILVRDNRIIVKQDTQVLSIPLEAVVNTTEDDVIVGEFNLEEARKQGEEWLRRSTNKLEFDEQGMLVTDKKKAKRGDGAER